MATPDKRKEILKAAGDCFAHYGYDKTTLDDIGRMVGLNKASLYYYYKSKESIFVEVIAMEAEAYICSVLEEVGKVEGCKEKILTYLTKRLEFIRSAANYHKLTFESLKNNIKPIMDELYEKNMDHEISCLSQILECCIKNGEITDCDTGKVARSILTVTEAIKNRTAHNADCNFTSDVNYSEVVNEVAFTVSLMLDGLKVR
jgi:AcrR family transcriptional regulator